MTKQRRATDTQSSQRSSPVLPQRPPVGQMYEEELLVWIRTTRAALQKKMARERTYLDRRASRGTRTPTDEAYEADQGLLADLIALLDEMELCASEGG